LKLTADTQNSTVGLNCLEDDVVQSNNSHHSHHGNLQRLSRGKPVI